MVHQRSSDLEIIVGPFTWWDHRSCGTFCGDKVSLIDLFLLLRQICITLAGFSVHHFGKRKYLPPSSFCYRHERFSRFVCVCFFLSQYKKKSNGY